MNKEFAWFLGFLCSDGCIVRPTYRKKGDERRISFCLHYKDREVLYKIKSILGTKASVRTYPDYKSPSAFITIYDREDILEKYGDIKIKVPDDILGFERHFIRGLIDGDGCLHYRKDRNSFRINIINQERSIIEWTSKALHEQLLIPLKEPKYKAKDHLYIVEWEGKVARFIAWYLYHGEIDGCVLDRKRAYYRESLQIEENMDYEEELFKAVNIKRIGKNLSMGVQHSLTLDWCKSIQRVLPYPTTPIPVNKGQRKYYELYIPHG